MPVPNLTPKMCTRCGSIYAPTGGTQKYCPNCKPEKKQARAPRREGSNVSNLDYKIKPAITHRICLLGEMNDRRERYLTEGNRAELLNLAVEYENMNQPMTRTANVIRREAEGV